MSKVTDDLKAAFSGESQASRKYNSFARKADQDGFPQIAKLFRAAAQAETHHAYNHLKAMGGINSTAENLQAAIAGENYEVESMYPEFIQEAEAEGVKKAVNTFRWAMEVEKGHAELYRKALQAAEKGEDAPQVEYFVCPFCGYTHEGPMQGACPVCGTPGEKFELIQ